jgi:hypothetical protein
VKGRKNKTEEGDGNEWRRYNLRTAQEEETLSVCATRSGTVMSRSESSLCLRSLNWWHPASNFTPHFVYHYAIVPFPGMRFSHRRLWRGFIAVYSTEIHRRFGRKCRFHLLVDFLFGVSFVAEDRGYIFVRNVGVLQPDYTSLDPRTPYTLSPASISTFITAWTPHLAGFWIDTAILNTHCEHNVAVTVAGELSLVIRFLSLMAALPFPKKLPCIFTRLLSLLSGCTL